ncbi:MAG: FKBP-type peptidyl-prolyl cis-trans isomerase, partial [Bacteroidota bacterium]
MTKHTTFFVFLVLLFTFSCQKKTEETQTDTSNARLAKSQAEIDEGKITGFLQEQKLTAESTPDGLYYIIEEPGGDEKPTLRSVVTVHYKGTLLNGKEFDSSYGKNPLRIRLAQLVKGWQKGIPLIGKGGKITLSVPSELGYCAASNPAVGP